MRYICAITITLMIIVLGLYKFGIIPFEFENENEQYFNAVIISDYEEKNYYDVYTIKKDNKKFLLYVKKNNEKFKIGDIVNIEASFNKPSEKRNFNGFDYNIYLRSKNIRGTYKAKSINKVKESKRLNTKILKIFSYIKDAISKIYQKNLSKENSALLIGLTIGDKSNIDGTTIENFRNASLSHILAISGAHLSYIVMGLSILTKQLKNKRLSQALTILSVIFFMVLTGMSPSVLRAGLMCIVPIIASMLKRKNDFYTTLCFSIFLQIIFNPYVIFDIGFILSYSGVIGIVLFYNEIFTKTKLKILSVTLSANIILIPIMAYYFNTLSISFLFSNLIASLILGPIIILGYLSTICRIKVIYLALNILISILIKSADFFSQMTFLRTNIVSPSLVSIIIYYIIIILWATKIRKMKTNENNNMDEQKVNKLKTNKLKIDKPIIKKTIAILVTIQIVSNINFIIFDNNNMYISFIDVGQGDCCLIRYRNMNLMIDSGGSEDNSNYDIGKNVLMRSLLSKKIKCLDYIMISHFDADHCQGFMYLLKNFEIKNAIIGFQAEDSKMYQEFLKSTKEKNIKVHYVKRGDSLKIGKIRILILNPASYAARDMIQDNPMNNNAMVCKIIFYKFSILFTGDIEKEAENEIVQFYKTTNTLEADILKVPHHGSKTSSTEEFLNLVKPKIALIGVGVNNKFKHPSKETVDKLKNRHVKIYRTDLNGEIFIKVNYNGKVYAKTKLQTINK